MRPGAGLFLGGFLTPPSLRGEPNSEPKTLAAGCVMSSDNSLRRLWRFRLHPRVLVHGHSFARVLGRKRREQLHAPAAAHIGF